MENRVSIKKKARIAVYSFFALIIVVIVIDTFNEVRIKKQVLGNYEKTIGTIEDVGTVGVESNIFLTYKYYVGKIKYKRTIQVSNRFENCCDSDDNKCCSAKYWVIYSVEKPNNSLINLTIDLQDIDNPTFPETLDYFR